MEEPKRALIAMEMLLNRNFWMPTEFGIPYYNKPPLYNWLLAGIFTISGSFSEFYVRLTSVLSFLLFGIIYFLLTKKYMGYVFALISALLFMVSVDIYFYFSLTGEIDLFYSLIVFSIIALIYYFSEIEQYSIMYIMAYFLAALGLLTKSFPTLAFLWISLMVVLWLNQSLRMLFSWAHFRGMAIFVFIIGAYLFIYSMNHDLEQMLAGMWQDSSKRTLTGNFGLDILNHLGSFPLDTMKNLMPASVFLVFFFQRSLLNKIKKNKFIFFSLLVFLANYFIYLISPGSRQRYIYALYPFMINVFVFLYYSYNKNWKYTYLNWITWIVLLAGLFICILLPFVPQFYDIEFITILSVLSSVAIIGIIILQYRKLINPVLLVIAVFVLMRIVFNMTVIPLRAQDQHASVRQSDGINIAVMVKEQPVYIYSKSLISNGLVYYIVRQTKDPVERVFDSKLDGFYLMDEKYFDHGIYSVYYESSHRDRTFRLVKFSN
jgi:4-amino-4-deoxy-L-arabinose transferase-like glycosyltransferase